MSTTSSPASPAPPSPPGSTEASNTEVAAWLALQSALEPIIGRGGFGALYQRCLHLALHDHPWLSEAQEAGDRAWSFEPLLRALSQQPPRQAAAAQAQLMRSFVDLLANLIGPSLVQRLLGTADPLAPSASRQQDPLP